MTASLRALLTGIIDYAGMFPPAQLPMDQAIRNYARYRTEPESWMLGRFICPAAKLNELSPYVDELFRDGPPLAISALGRGGNDIASFLDGVRNDLLEIEGFLHRHNEMTIVDVLETKLPSQLMISSGPNSEVEDTQRAIQTFDSVASMIEKSQLKTLTTFFEPFGGLQGEQVDMVSFHILVFRGAIKAISGKEKPLPGGVKIRCGGLEASAFPSCQRLVDVLDPSKIGANPIKFTAGLHHPIRHFDSALNTKMHGFINVFAAGAFASTLEHDADVILPIIEDENAENFIFDDSSLRWRDHRVKVRQIEAARRNNVISFGSCSFDEPREDLKSLGWL